jgi:hypothetical protein
MDECRDVDGLDGIAAASLQVLSFIELEERRRTFWMAYTIDHITSLLDRLPLTFDQRVVSEPARVTDMEQCPNR